MAEYIERDSVLDLIGEHQKSLCPRGLWGRRFSNDKNAYDEWQVVLDEIDSIPASDVSPVVHGRWIKGVPVGLWDKPDGYRCSNCGAVILGMPPPYCQMCGAKMDKEASDGLEDS